MVAQTRVPARTAMWWASRALHNVSSLVMFQRLIDSNGDYQRRVEKLWKVSTHGFAFASSRLWLFFFFHFKVTCGRTAGGRQADLLRRVASHPPSCHSHCSSRKTPISLFTLLAHRLMLAHILGSAELAFFFFPFIFPKDFLITSGHLRPFAEIFSLSMGGSKSHTSRQVSILQLQVSSYSGKTRASQVASPINFRPAESSHYLG